MNPTWQVLLVIGVAVLGFGLMSFQSLLARKLAGLCIMGVTWLTVWFLSGSMISGILAALCWLLLPWVEILTRIRRLRLPMEKILRNRFPPNEEVFPGLDEITTGLKELGFTQSDDVGWDWEETKQFFRLFHKEDEGLQAAICMNEQDEMMFYYLSFSSRAKDGRIWTTWNYPFPYSLKFVPALKMFRVPSDLPLDAMLETHRHHLEKENVLGSDLVPLNQEDMPRIIQSDIRDQIHHNLHLGVLIKTDEGMIRYTWRGLLFLWCQFLRDLVRIS